MKEFTGNEWDGFDNQSIVYDDKKEKHWQSSVWKVIAFFSAAMLIYIFSNHMKELYIINHGNNIEAVYNKDIMVASCFDKNGEWHSYDLSGYYPVVQNDHVILYYMDDIKKAQPRNSTISRILFYMFFGVILVFAIFRIVKIYGYHKKLNLQL